MADIFKVRWPDGHESADVSAGALLLWLRGGIIKDTTPVYVAAVQRWLPASEAIRLKKESTQASAASQPTPPVHEETPPSAPEGNAPLAQPAPVVTLSAHAAAPHANEGDRTRPEIVPHGRMHEQVSDSGPTVFRVHGRRSHEQEEIEILVAAESSQDAFNAAVREGLVVNRIEGSPDESPTARVAAGAAPELSQQAAADARASVAASEIPLQAPLTPGRTFMSGYAIGGVGIVLLCLAALTYGMGVWKYYGVPGVNVVASQVGWLIPWLLLFLLLSLLVWFGVGRRPRIGATLLACLLLWGSIDHTRSQLREVGQARAMASECSRLFEDLGSDADISPGPADPAVFGASAPFVSSARDWAHGFQAHRRELRARIQAAEFGSMLLPRYLGSKQDIEASLRRLVDFVDFVDRFGADVPSRLDQYERDLRALPIGPELRRSALDGFAQKKGEAVDSVLTFVSVEREVEDATDEMLRFYLARQGTYYFRGQSPVFQSGADAEAYNQLQQQLLAAAEKESAFFQSAGQSFFRDLKKTQKSRDPD